jgi:hypothetical protein
MFAVRTEMFRVGAQSCIEGTHLIDTAQSKQRQDTDMSVNSAYSSPAIRR